ncbi:MAG: SPW repeat protein [Betaproteobacteria bacterium]|nr:SPW repeat protein [Betaproteobacteria bacterium]
MSKKQWKNWVTLIAGIWLAASPWALGHAEEPSRMFYNAVVAGLAATLLAIADIYLTTERSDPPNIKTVVGMLIVGLWTVASPWVLGFETQRDMVTSTVVAGVVVAAVSLWQLVDRYDITDSLPQ